MSHKKMKRRRQASPRPTYSIEQLRQATRELAEMGLLRDTGKRQRNPRTGAYDEVVWEIIEGTKQ